MIEVFNITNYSNPPLKLRKNEYYARIVVSISSFDLESVKTLRQKLIDNSGDLIHKSFSFDAHSIQHDFTINYDNKTNYSPGDIESNIPAKLSFYLFLINKN